MKMECTKILNFKIGKKKESLEVKTYLKFPDYYESPKDNWYQGMAEVDSIYVEHPFLRNCVNAELAVDEIIKDKIIELKKKYGSKFKIIGNEIEKKKRGRKRKNF